MLTIGSGRCCGRGPGGDTRRRAKDGSRPAPSGRPDHGCGTSQTQRCRGRPCCPGTATPRSSATSRSGDAAVPWTPTHDRTFQGSVAKFGFWRWSPKAGPRISRAYRCLQARKTNFATEPDGLLPRTPVHDVTKPLQQGIESDPFRVKKTMPRIGGFQAFGTARRTIQGFEARLGLRKGFGFAGAWTVREQNRLLRALLRSPAG